MNICLCVYMCIYIYIYIYKYCYNEFYSGLIVAPCTQCLCTFVIWFVCLSSLYVLFSVTALLFTVANQFQE